MTQNEANRGLIAIMEALDVAGDAGAPRGLIEAGLVASGQFGADDARALLTIAERGGLVTGYARDHRDSKRRGLTARGRDLLAQARAFAAGAATGSAVAS
jgi:hypothetical protein